MMTIKQRLILMNFLQFFVWGAWLITIGTYWLDIRKWNGGDFGLMFGMLGWAALITPTLVGIIADKWLNAEKLYAILHIFSAAFIFCFSKIDDPKIFKWFMLGAMLCYMPTLSLSYNIAYNLLKKNGGDVIKDFPPIRVFGTLGFIVAMWVTNSTKSNINVNQFYISIIASVVLVIFSFVAIPACPPTNQSKGEKSLIKILGLEGFSLFKEPKIASFFLFSILLGAALQLTNMYGDTFLNSFKENPIFENSFIVKDSGKILSISQFSEMLFILAIPFFLKRFGIKIVMLISMLAWVLRFGLFAFGSPTTLGTINIILSCIVYGMAFDFFNISGSLFIETNTPPKIQSSAQGIFMMMTNGIGSIIGSYVSGYAIDHFFTNNGVKNWYAIWLSFSIYALIVAILFAIFFKHKHRPEQISTITH